MTRGTSTDPEAGVPAPVAPAPADDLGRVALVFALVAVGAAVIPVVNWFSPWVALVAVVLAIFALCLPRLPRRRAALSLGLSLLAFTLSALLPPVYAGNAPDPLWWFGGSAATSGARVVPAATTITYEVTGTVPTARVVWSPTSRPEDGFTLEESAALPFARDVAVEAGDLTRAGGAPLVLGGTLGEDGGEITCRMRVGDRTLVEQTATGPGATAGCSTATVDPELLPAP
ncbi:hypothetical protein JOE37_000129 [Clavibacter michiganensis]|nr:hypothetical protein [Clavibacter michiganensis]